MKQVINIIFKANKEIVKVRKKFGIESKIKPHITLAYPFENVDQKELIKHIKKSIKTQKPFKITLKELQKSTKEYYLYLLVDKGKKQILQLYKKLNSTLLKDFKNPDMPKYIPHITLGVFHSKKEIDKAIKESKRESLKMETIIDYICLLTLNSNNKIISTKKFKLK